MGVLEGICERSIASALSGTDKLTLGEAMAYGIDVVYVPRRRHEPQRAVAAGLAAMSMGVLCVFALLAYAGYDAESIGHSQTELSSTKLIYDDVAKLFKQAKAEMSGGGVAGSSSKSKSKFKLPDDVAKLFKQAKAEVSGGIQQSSSGSKSSFKLPSDVAKLFKQAKSEQAKEKKVAAKLAKGEKAAAKKKKK